MDLKEFSTVKNHLPVGYANIIKERLNNKFSNSYIYKVLNGNRYNNEIISAAILLAEQTQEFSQSLYNRLSTISTKN